MSLSWPGGCSVVPGPDVSNYVPWVGSSQHACLRAQSPQSCPTLCDHMDCSPPNSSVRKILQAGEGYWRGLPFPPPGDLPPDPGMEPMSLKSPVLRGGLFTTCATWEAPEAIRKNVKTGRDLKRFFIWSHLLIHPRGPERVSQLVSRAAGTRYQ